MSFFVISAFDNGFADGGILAATALLNAPKGVSIRGNYEMATISAQPIYIDCNDLSVGKHSNALMKFILDLHRYPSGVSSIYRDWVTKIKDFYPHLNKLWDDSESNSLS